MDEESEVPLFHKVETESQETSGFRFSGLKSNVDTGESYMELPPEAMLMSTEETKENEHDEALKKFLERNRVLKVLSRTITELYARFTAMRPHHDPAEYFVEILAEYVPRDPEQDKLDVEIDALSTALKGVKKDCRMIREKLNKRQPEANKIYEEYSGNESEADDKGKWKERIPPRRYVRKVSQRWEDNSNPFPPPPTARRDKISYHPSRMTTAGGRRQVQESLAILLQNQNKEKS